MSTKKRTLKHKGKGPQAITANDLRSGEVVYLNPKFLWTPQLSKALVETDKAQIEAMLAAGRLSETENLVVDVYPIDMEPDGSAPTRYREKFRMNGPSYNPGV